MALILQMDLVEPKSLSLSPPHPPPRPPRFKNGFIRPQIKILIASFSLYS